MQAAPDGEEAPRLSRAQQELIVVRKLFFGGCFLLPWLWIVALVFFRKRWNDDAATPQLRACKNYTYIVTL